jgi:hypothetical protein
VWLSIALRKRPSHALPHQSTISKTQVQVCSNNMNTTCDADVSVSGAALKSKGRHLVHAVLRLVCDEGG